MALMRSARRPTRPAKVEASLAYSTRWMSLTKMVSAISRPLFSLQSLAVANLLLSKTGRGTLRSDLMRLISAVASADFDLGGIKPLLKSALWTN
ncbi:hypothetical protein MKZ38_009541 [Zalerion maritima]|uniref:Uncharacterized protein n=1 Tax=Zalerion maritima TaxID=339359 RepID=A0AAD5WM17_9PEZI|nr:hypothetical protein MKZ38_009541 [Zalerion maritima]